VFGAFGCNSKRRAAATLLDTASEVIASLSLMPTKKIRSADATGSTYFIKCMKDSLQILPGRRHSTFKCPKNDGLPMRQQMDKDHKGEDGDREGEEDWDNIVDGEAKTISSQQANVGNSGQSSLACILTGKRIAITGISPPWKKVTALMWGRRKLRR
jgi:hypothetical protein